jgi:purine nucleoside phosphorylase
MTIQTRRERERAERERLIVSAARELAETEGWDAVTTRRLAAVIEYSQPVLYSHFKDKGAIMAAVAVQGCEEIAAEMRTARTAARGAREALTAVGETFLPSGTAVVIQGPRFSTRSESRWFSSMGWGVINMTAYPEGWLARELELCYANVSLITDYDVGLEDDPGVEPVSHDVVVRVFTENNERLRRLLFAAIPKIGRQPQDICATALAGARF